MRIEHIKPELVPLGMEEIRRAHALMGLKTKKVFPLTNKQFEYLQMLRAGTPIAEIVGHYHKQGDNIQFQALYSLVEFLTTEGFLIHPGFTQYFAEMTREPAGLIESLIAKVVNLGTDVIRVREEVTTLPFFRVLDEHIVRQFLAHAKVIETPRGIFVCQAGQKQRSLFVLLRGQATVYRHNPNGSRTPLATLKQSSVFGEVGFFLGHPRTADVVTDEDSVILQIQHLPEYDEQFTSTSGPKFQKRLRLIQALQKSPAFGELPSDCFDELATTGKIRQFNAHHMVCTQGDPGRSVYILIEGRARVLKNHQEIRTLGPGDCFGELALLKSAGKRTASVETTAETVALEIDADDFYKLLAENLTLACEFESIAQRRT